MIKSQQHLNNLIENPSKFGSELNGNELGSMKDEWIGINQWISLSIEGKRDEIIKQQMTYHMNRMKTFRFVYQV